MDKYEYGIKQQARESYENILKGINERIQRLIKLKTLTNNDNMKRQIDEIIERLSFMKSTDKSRNFRFDETYNNHNYRDYDYRDLKYHRLDKIAEKKRDAINNAEPHIGWNMFRLARLEKREGRILKKQLKVVDKLACDKLSEYQYDQKFYLSKVDKYIKDAEKELTRMVLTNNYQQKADDTMIKIRPKTPSKDPSKMTYTERKQYEKEQEALKYREVMINQYAQSRINQLQRKPVTYKADLNAYLATDVKPSLIQRMKNAAKKLGHVVKNGLYKIPYEYEDKHK